MREPGTLTAVLWDFDGTLVDTRAKNMSVNRRIIEEITGRPWTAFEVMQSEEVYERAQRISVNWREFYREHFGLDEQQVTKAGSRWTPYQLEDPTPTPTLEGIRDALTAFDGMPQGVVSQNCSSNIADTLAVHGIQKRFGCIIGYAEVADLQQKPAPDGLLLAIEQLTGFAPGSVLYVGDHETDLKTATSANRVLAERGLPVRVLSVAALYGVDGDPEPWTERANFRADSPMAVVEIVRGLS